MFLVWTRGAEKSRGTCFYRASQPGKGQRSVCVHVRACTRCRGVRVGAGCSWAVCGGGDRVRMRVCTPCGAGGVCVRVPGVCLGMVQAERDAARRKGRRSVCVCVCVVYTRGVWCEKLYEETLGDHGDPQLLVVILLHNPILLRRRMACNLFLTNRLWQQ